MPRRPRTRAAAALAAGSLALLLAATPDARARDGSSLSDAPRVVELTVRGEDPVAFEDTLRELMARLRVSVARASGAATPVLARVQVDLVSPQEAVVVVVDGRSGQVLLRRSVPRRASAAIVREELAHAAQGAVEAELVADEDRPAPAAPPPSPAPPVASIVGDAPPSPDAASPRAASRSALALDVATVAGVGPFASASGAVFRIGAGVVLASRRGLRPSLGLGAQLALPFDASTAVVVSHASLVSARAIPAIEVLRASWLALDVGVGGGVDVLSVAPRSPVLPASSLGRPTTRVDGVLTGLAAAHLPIADSVVLTVAAALDVDLASRRYVVDEGGAPSEVLAPWRVRPTLLAGITFTPLGAGLFARHEVRP
jgi:hypothetical protein